MTKKKISKKPEFSFKDITFVKLKKGVKIVHVDTAKRLRDPEFAAQALWESLKDGDVESFKEILRGYLEVVNKRDLAKKSKISRRTIHRILEKDGNPTLKNISKVIHALCA